MTRTQNRTFQVGQLVSWRAAGKVSRCDGVAGQKVEGRILEIQGEWLRVIKHYNSLCSEGIVHISNARIEED